MEVELNDSTYTGRRDIINVKITYTTRGGTPSSGQTSDPPGHNLPACEFCKATPNGRNLIISFDGTSNQFGENNTNVVELYSRIVKNESQLTYYNSGVGTYARPIWRSCKYWKQVVYNAIDLAIAWNFENVLLAGYRWLSDNYRPGDKIFLFGFSRGAYQVRALAEMINKVGLILPGNQEQIPFAYELYADLRSDIKDPSGIANRFKKTFSREEVKIHFLGAWDTVSSVGIIRGKALPGTNEYNAQICYFRHALALDERRVKFQPEYICGGDSIGHAGPSSSTNTTNARPEQGNPNENIDTDDADKRNTKHGIGKAGPRVKEVWFAGCHSDIGGGTQSNTELNNAAPPVLWMGNEAMLAGLELHPSEVQWNWDKLRNTEPSESLSFVWRFFEILPMKRLLFDGEQTTWFPHLAESRIIKPGQKIHASVCFIDKKYTPQATFVVGETNKIWKSIVGVGETNSIDWAEGVGIKELLEMDLFDHSRSNVDMILSEVKKNTRNVDFLGRLDFLAATREGSRTIVNADSNFVLFCNLFDSDDIAKAYGVTILSKLVGYEITGHIVKHAGVIELLRKFAQDPDSKVQDSSADLLGKIAKYYGTLSSAPHIEQYGTSKNLASIYFARFSQTGLLPDLDRAIGQLRNALTLQSTSHIKRPDSLTDLAIALTRRFEQSGDCENLNESISFYIRALKHRPNSDLLNTILTNFPGTLMTRFDRSGQPRDLDAAIFLHRYALDLQAALHPDRPTTLSKLIVALLTRFEQSGQRKDLDDVISLDQEALKLQPVTHPNRSASLNTLALLLKIRFEQSGRLKDLDKAISLHRQALELRAVPHPDRSTSLNNLAVVLRTRFDQLGQYEELVEAISLLREALQLRVAPHPNLSTSLNNLGGALKIRFEKSGHRGDLDEAISLHRQALELRAVPHPDRSTSLNNLAVVLRTRFGQLRQIKDLDEAIALLREALELRVVSHPDRFTPLNNLAGALMIRFEQLGQSRDLDEAIYLDREALQLQPVTHPNRPASLNNLAVALTVRFGQSGQPGDIDEAISLDRDALELRPAHHPGRSGSLTNLGIALMRRFERFGQCEELDEAILLFREALQLQPTSHPDRYILLQYLHGAINIRFEKLRHEQDHEELCLLRRKAHELQVAPHPNRSTALNGLRVAGTLMNNFAAVRLGSVVAARG